ncbi:MAG TPA: DUF5615 family PIN-like protein [Thermoplasmata archaeon]|nr:DUF5615 family PIN-like protein [Thermoplasmata archaeon]
MDGPRLLADEMVGRLARYLRFQGCDTEYVRGASDDEVLRRAAEEGRVIVTRDRALARRAPRALLLSSGSLRDQWIAVARAFPEIPRTVAMTRCTLCNGPLVPDVGAPPSGGAPDAAGPLAPRGGPTVRCARCGHRYWEGSHTARVRQRLAAWSAEIGP